MRDFTRGSVITHVLTMAAPALVGMLAHIAYQLIDLYFIAQIGAAATAGVNTAGNAVLIIGALAQVLAVGTVALVAQAVGRRDQVDANVLFNQAMALSMIFGLITMAFVYVFMHTYLRAVSADQATADAGTAFIYWVLPGYIFSLPMAVLAAALRGMGIVKPAVVFYLLTVALNAVLAPVLIAGVGTNIALGVKGAGLATSISTLIGTVVLAIYLRSIQQYVSFSRALMRPQLKHGRRILKVGSPVGAEVLLTFLSAGAVYYAIRNFGASAQAGFGIGWRIFQAVMLPGIAVAFAAGPIVAQSFGARDGVRVREAIRKTVLLGSAVMMMTTVLVRWRPGAFVGIFDADPAALAVAMAFLQSMSWVFIAQGLICICASVFQGLGNTLPSLISSCTCLVVFTVPLLWLSMHRGFHIDRVWHLLMLSVVLQTFVSLCLLRVEIRRKLLPMLGYGSDDGEARSIREVEKSCM